jgi:hypothetical protein
MRVSKCYLQCVDPVLMQEKWFCYSGDESVFRKLVARIIGDETSLDGYEWHEIHLPILNLFGDSIRRVDSDDVELGSLVAWIECFDE